MSHASEQLAREQLPPGIEFRDLGERRLRDLARPEHVFQLVGPDLVSDFPPLRSLDVLPNNLPVQVTSFVGREREIGEITALLAERRLVTLVGPGGTGKTRLSVQVAANLVESFADGVWLVELAPLSDPVLLPQAVAAALSVREEADRPVLTTIVEYVRDRTLLLILDNCEHLIEACARLADQLVRRCPKLRILASSREALGVPAEAIFRVPSLSLPDVQHPPSPERLAEYEAVRLLSERGKSVKPDFAITDANVTAVVQICQRLDGIPLAIELAAARLRVLSVQEIAAHLDKRFRLLTAGNRAALPRHQTLKGLIDWSYELLSETERALLRRLAVFAGRWSLAAADAVCSGDGVAEDEILDVLSRLVDKSLIVLAEDDGETRYSLLETIRQYGADRLRESREDPRVRARHRDFYLGLAEDAERHLHQADQAGWLRRLEDAHDDLRAALAWSIESEEIDVESSVWSIARAVLGHPRPHQRGTQLARADLGQGRAGAGGTHARQPMGASQSDRRHGPHVGSTKRIRASQGAVLRKPGPVAGPR